MSRTVEATVSDPGRTAVTLIDCDVHNAPNSISELRPFLSKRWQQYVCDSGFEGPPGPVYPKAFSRAARRDAWPPGGGLPGGDPDFARQQLLDAWKIDFAILNPLYNVAAVHNIDFAVALMVVTPQDPSAAAAEIRRLGQDGRFVQVLLLVRSEAPYGKRQFHPIFEAASEVGLPVGLHFGGGGHPITPCGWPSYYLEDHTGMSLAFQAQVTSLVVEGVFEKFSAARVTLIEGGFAWLPPLMWRLDKNFRALRDEVPWLSRLPSEYIRQHFRATTQPIEEPPNPGHLMDIMDMIGCDEFLLFATDYPHWDFDAPDRSIPAGLSHDLRRRIMSTNAADYYDFERA